jgi:hypothetical protein
MSDRTPEEIKESILKQLNSPIIDALDNEGITPSYLAKLLKKELEAKHVKVFQHQGEIIESEPLEALDIRQKARQDAHKLRGDYPAERKHITGDVGPLIIELVEPSRDEEGDIGEPE